jgi:two-component sensor histidine kinase
LRLITNAIKHAFLNRQSGNIYITVENTSTVENASPTNEPQSDLLDSSSATLVNASVEVPLKQPPCKYVLTVQDDGIGISEDLDIANLKSLGLKIAFDLALQLRGKLELSRLNGTRFQLLFSELNYRKRL